MKINKIYIISPGNKDNGGGESLHQLVDTCNRFGYDAYIYYIKPKRNTVIDKMKIYNIKVAVHIEDAEDNLLVCPEMYTYSLKKYKKIIKAIWFLSLDYYLRSVPSYRTRIVLKKWGIPSCFYPVTYLAVVMGTYASTKTFNFRKDRVKYFLYNVEYAHEYIEKECCYEHISQYLCGPINEIYYEKDKGTYRKERIVTYNPKKSTEFTKQIIKYCKEYDPSVEFIPIENMQQTDVKKLLAKASVYMDFGFFPGPERIPREAVMSMCNVITSDLGSASNSIDVPIEKCFKFSLDVNNIQEIAKLITDMVTNYEKYVPKYENYRLKVIQQKKEFDSNVQFFLKRVENDKT